MASENETVEDIVADIRAQNQGLPEDDYALSPLVCDLLSFANRIEAAHQREVDKFNFDLMTIKSEQKTSANVIIEQTNKCEELKREVAGLRECLKEAIREKCPFTRMSCKHGEPCDYECETDKWRKALKGASND